jgi:hypothetical protein
LLVRVCAYIYMKQYTSLCFSHSSPLHRLCPDAAVSEGELPPSVKAYDAYYTASVEPFLAACKALGLGMCV